MKAKGTLMIRVGLVLIASALLLTAYNIVGSNIADMRAGRALDELSAQVREDAPPAEGRDLGGSEIEYPDYVIDPGMSMPSGFVKGVGYVGIIIIPALDLKLPVAADWDYDILKYSPCRYSGTAYRDDLVICAHNYRSQFGRLRSLSYGDYVILTDMDGNEFDYTVSEIETLKPTAISEMTESDYELTLFTCTMRGSARLAVRCSKVK